MMAGRYGRLRRVIEDNKGIVKESIECCVYYMINPKDAQIQRQALCTYTKENKKERKTNQVVY